MFDAQSAFERDMKSADAAGDDSEFDSAAESFGDSAFESFDDSAGDSASYSDSDSSSAVSVTPRRLKGSIPPASNCTVVCGVSSDSGFVRWKFGM